MMTRMITLPKGLERQQGLAAMEFAITLPLIILIALAVTELGRGLYQYNTLTKAVQDGARYLSDNSINTLGLLDITLIDTANGQAIDENAKRLVVYGDIDGGTPVLSNFDTATVTVTAIDVFMPGASTLPGGDISPNHVRVSATYTFEPLFPALSALGYSMVPTMTASAVGRALKI